MNPFRLNGNSVKVGTLTESLEDYLEIIFRLIQKRKVARVRDIAKEKGVKTSSVISALQRLAKEGLIEYQVREFVDLTENGRELAFRLHQRHVFLKRFLIDLLQVDDETAERDACSMEHSISVTTLDRIAAISEFLTYCPKVSSDLISIFRDCWLVQPENHSNCQGVAECGLWQHKNQLARDLGIQSVRAMKRGQKGFIARIMADAPVRSELIGRGFLPAASIESIQTFDDGRQEVIASGEKKILSAEEVDAVFVWFTGDDEGVSVDQESRCTLAQVKPGFKFKVVRLQAQGEIRQRLLDMGFIRGVEGMVLREALLKDPIEIELKGYLLSLRRSEAMDIEVERT